MAARHDNYAKMRLPFLQTHRWCEVRKGGTCTSTATQVHHFCSRGRAPWMVDDLRNFVAICDPCHEIITRPVTEDDGDWSACWTLHSFYFPHYEVELVDDLPMKTDQGELIVRLTGVPESQALVTEGFAVAMGPGWVDLEHGAEISFRNDDPTDARLANIAARRV